MKYASPLAISLRTCRVDRDCAGALAATAMNGMTAHTNARPALSLGLTLTSFDSRSRQFLAGSDRPLNGISISIRKIFAFMFRVGTSSFIEGLSGPITLQESSARRTLDT